jgi:hypothetical protein
MTDDYAIPRDPWTERTVAGGLLAAESIPADVRVTREMFFDPHLREVVAACIELQAHAKPCDPVAARTELMRAGLRGQVIDAVWLFELMQAGCPVSQIGHYTKTLLELAVRRDLIAAATRALQAAGNPSSDPYDVAAILHVDAASIADSANPLPPPAVVDGADFVDGDISFDWLMRGLLERGDRFLITGGEGSGKSVLSRQIAMTTAAGVHPFTGERMEPRKVLLVDLENGTRHLRRALRALWDHASAIGRPVQRGMLTVESRPSGIDLTGIEDRAWLRRLCEHVHPDLLVIGPLYRMHAADMNAEEPARLLTRTIDEIRASVGCAVVLETHAPHGQSGMVRNLRPVGSSLFRRWPEFGYGLRQQDEDGHVMNLVAWRGARDERDFPTQLARGGPQEWPWSPHRAYRMPAGWAEESA